jgi:hypothetical protein
MLCVLNSVGSRIAYTLPAECATIWVPVNVTPDVCAICQPRNHNRQCIHHNTDLAAAFTTTNSLADKII